MYKSRLPHIELIGNVSKVDTRLECKPQVQRNWRNFKAHFRKAHQELKETSNLQVQDTTYHANSIKEMIQDLRNKIQAASVPQPTQDIVPPLTSVSENSSDSSISALQSEVASLKDFINNMQQPYQFPAPPPPPTQYLPPMTWPQQYCMPINPYQAYANQAFTHPIQ